MAIDPHLSRPCVLIVDDDRIQLETLCALLKADYHVVTATTGEEALVKLDATLLPDLILLELILPDHSGFVLCQLLKAGKATTNIPVIFLTIDNDALHEAQGFSLGAADYIKKPVDITVIKARIERQLQLDQVQKSMANDNQSLRQSLLKISHVQAEMKQLADTRLSMGDSTHFDLITGLPNRHALQAHWTRLSEQHTDSHNTGIAVLMIGLDTFAHIEEALGYTLSDRLLKQVATLLKFNLETDDYLMHFNRDEFIAFLPNTADVNHAEIRASEIIQLFSHPVCLESHEISLSLNIGLVHTVRSSRQELNTFLEAAVKAMNQAKKLKPNSTYVQHDVML